MINSKPADKFLDHDHIEDIYGRIYVVIGNTHPPGFIYAYMKYIPTKKKTFWCRGRLCYERIVKRYGVRNVMSVVKELQEYSYDPVLDAKAPRITTKYVHKHYKPRDRLQEMIKQCNDNLEYLVLDVIDRLKLGASLSYSSIGITGSILVGIHNVEISDIDLIIYGCKESLEVVNTCIQNLSKIPKEELMKRLSGQSRIYGLDISTLLKLEPPYRNLRFKGRNVNIMFCSDVSGRYGEEVYRQVGTIEALVEVTPNQCRALFYPSKALIHKVHRVYSKPRSVNLEDLKYGLRCIVSYESIYSYALFKGGLLRVKGILEKVYPEGHYVVLIGGFEEPGFAIPTT